MGKSFSKWDEKEFREYLNGEGKEQAERFVKNMKKGNIVVVVKHVAKSGMSREQVLAGFVGSQECAELVARFGI